MMKLGEVEKDLRVTRRTLYRWIKAGKIVVVKLPGGGYRISPEELNRIKLDGTVSKRIEREQITLQG